MVLTQPLSLYIHIPFCHTKCPYCAFNTYVQLENLIPSFMDALTREITIVAEASPLRRVHTVYLGGGTPSQLTPVQHARILDTVRSHFDLTDDAEISLEANPDDLTTPYMTALRDLGYNRISIGMQSANPRELELFERRHSQQTTVEAVSAARQGGFRNLNLDLIYGIPGQTLADWENSLRALLDLGPDHISLYALGVEDETPLQAWINSGKLTAPDDDLMAEMYDLATDMLAAAGYTQYEISNWAKPGYQCQHNLQYWRNVPYVGVGPGAHGFAGGVRYSTILHPRKYIAAMQLPRESEAFPYTPATDQAVQVDRENEVAETLLMGLRLTQEGIQRETFRQRFGADVMALQGKTLEKHARYGLLDITDTAICLTPKGRLLSNVIFRDLIPD